MNHRKINSADSFNIYKTSYKTDINWDFALDDDVNDWLDLFCKGNNCQKNMVMPALLTLTSALCGPQTRVEGNGEAFKTSLNTFAFVVADPGAGKSAVFEKVNEPVVDMYEEKLGKRLSLENYTTAGIHRHQKENCGYGLVTSDEGHRFLSSVQAKQGKGEGERALLCKIWNGKGDSVNLADGNRDFHETSISLFIMIQPQPFLHELGNFTTGDGLLDRFFVFSILPKLNNSSVVRESYKLLQDSPLTSFKPVFERIFDDHKDSRRTYKLSEAQKYYDIITDHYAEYINEKYSNEEFDQDKENSSPSQHEDTFMVNSKDTIHILRITCLLHILNTYLLNALNPGLYTETDDVFISVESLKSGKKIYYNMAQQKSVFLEAIHKLDTTETLACIQKVKTFRERSVRCISHQQGPQLSLRHMQRHIKGSIADNIRVELEKLQQEGFGKILSVSVKGHSKKEIIMKPAPATILHENKILMEAHISFETYAHNFSSIKNDSLLELSSHYQYDIIADIFK